MIFCSPDLYKMLELFGTPTLLVENGLNFIVLYSCACASLSHTHTGYSQRVMGKNISTRQHMKQPTSIGCLAKKPSREEKRREEKRRKSRTSAMHSRIVAEEPKRHQGHITTGKGVSLAKKQEAH